MESTWFSKAAGNDVQRLTMIFQQGREWAKEYAPVIAVHQLDGGAEGMQYPTMDHLYMSKTGLQGEADAIIMLGKSNEPGRRISDISSS